MDSYGNVSVNPEVTITIISTDLLQNLKARLDYAERRVQQLETLLKDNRIRVPALDEKPSGFFQSLRSLF